MGVTASALVPAVEALACLPGEVRPAEAGAWVLTGAFAAVRSLCVALAAGFFPDAVPPSFPEAVLACSPSFPALPAVAPAACPGAALGLPGPVPGPVGVRVSRAGTGAGSIASRPGPGPITTMLSPAASAGLTSVCFSVASRSSRALIFSGYP